MIGKRVFFQQKRRVHQGLGKSPTKRKRHELQEVIERKDTGKHLDKFKQGVTVYCTPQSVLGEYNKSEQKWGNRMDNRVNGAKALHWSGHRGNCFGYF